MVTKTATGLNVLIPNTAGSLAYGVSTDGKTTAIIDFASSVAGVTNLLKTTAGNVNNLVFGSVVNYGINKVSNNFTGIYGLRGKYKVSIVLTDIPLRTMDGTKLTPLTITVPTSLDSTGGVATSTPISGTGLVGYITLVD
jgi:hypothetical protein